MTHCHKHALRLAVKNTTAGLKLLRDAKDSTSEICELIKFSKCQCIVEQLKNDIQLETPELKMLCPTRWAVHVESFREFIEFY